MIRKILKTGILGLIIFQISYGQVPGEISYHDESVMPGGKKGERIRSLIATVNSKTPDQIRRFMNEDCTEKFRKIAPMEQHINVFLSFGRQTGGVDFHSIRTYVPERKGETIVILKDRNFDSWRAFTIRFEESEESLIAGININNARTPSNVKGSTISEKKFIQMTKDILQRISSRDAFSGTVLIAKGD